MPLLSDRNQFRLQRYGKKLKNTNKIVKNLKTYGIIALMLGIGTLANAQVKNYIGLWAEGGEWSLMTDKDCSYKNSMGVAGAAGLVYDLQAGHFIMDLGVGARYGLTSFNQSSNAQIEMADQLDKDGQRFTYVYDMKDRKDQYTDLSLQVPVLLGGQWGRFYCLAGVKANLSLLTQAKSKAKLTTWGEYTEFDHFTNMPEYQFFTDYNYNLPNNTPNFNFNLDASAEIGARLGFYTTKTGWDVPKVKTQYRLALFADYGLLNLHSNPQGGALPALTPPNAYSSVGSGGQRVVNDMVAGLKLNDIMSTEAFRDHKVNNLLIGLKLTVLFELPKSPNCVICKDDMLPNYRSTGSTARKYRGKVAK